MEAGVKQGSGSFISHHQASKLPRLARYDCYYSIATLPFYWHKKWHVLFFFLVWWELNVPIQKMLSVDGPHLDSDTEARLVHFLQLSQSGCKLCILKAEPLLGGEREKSRRGGKHTVQIPTFPGRLIHSSPPPCSWKKITYTAILYGKIFHTIYQFPFYNSTENP